MRRIVTAITAASLALSMMALTMPAAAATGFDSAYAGESAFLTLSPGQSGTFTVFFANTGTTSWVKGTATQVDLAACLDDKVTCNAQDANDAAFNPGGSTGWLSATRYATASQTTVAPGSIGTFTYNVAVPASQAAGIYDLNGALVVSATGADVHDEGYYQDINVSGPSGTAATLISLTPITGSTAGGTAVTINGTGFACTPAFPSVSFGTTAGTVTSCGSTTLTVTSPAGTAGSVNVTVTNAGAPASNALSFTYVAPAPNFTSVVAYAGTTIAKLSFDQPVCVAGGGGALVAGDITATDNGIADNPLTGSFTAADCNTPSTSSSITISVPTAFTAGDFVAVTVTASGAAKIQNSAGTVMSGPQTQTTTASSSATTPQMSSAAATGTSTIKVKYTEAVTCANTALNAAQFTATTGGNAYTGTAIACGGAPLGSTSVTVTFGANNISAGGTISYTATAGNQIVGISGVKAQSPQSIAYSAVPAPTPPVITAAAVTQNGSTTAFGDTTGGADAFTLTFNEAMNTATAGVSVQVVDNDPGAIKSVATFSCGAALTCTWNSSDTVLTMTMAANPGFTLNVTGTDEAANGGLFLPLTITGTTGLTDQNSSSAVNLAGSVKTIQ